MLSGDAGISSTMLAAILFFLSSLDSIDTEEIISFILPILRYITMKYFVATVAFLR